MKRACPPIPSLTPIRARNLSNIKPKEGTGFGGWKQTLEQRTQRRSKASRSKPHGPQTTRAGNSGHRKHRRANGEEARTAETRGGYRWGKTFEGYSASGNGKRTGIPRRRPSWQRVRKHSALRPTSARGRSASTGLPDEALLSRAATFTDGWKQGRRSAGPAAERVELCRNKPETWRTPWSAVGCNKPAARCAE
jgi:hypothetical protein